jgi:ketosteroid isomerase-like protein
MANDPGQVAIDYIAAVGEKDFDRLDALLHPDLVGWTGGQEFDRAAWAKALQNFGLILLRNEIRQTIVDRDQVGIVYDFVTDTPVGVVPCVEILKVQDGKIREARLVFEFARWPEVMAELRKRATA